MVASLVFLSVTLALGCGGGGGNQGADDLGVDLGPTDAGYDAGHDAGHDAGYDAGHDAGPPVSCANLPGLYVPGSCSVLASGVMPYSPRFELWSDAAVKDRFILLPQGSTIDATDPDAWIYPVGTTLWKHFRVGGMLVETRMLKKVSVGIGVGAWEMRTFQWNAAQDDVTEVVNGAQNVLGTPHDIPAQLYCQECHRTKDVVNGFSAIQLNHASAGVPLSYLIANGVLANLPAGFAATDAAVPGTPTEIAALGYLHANCGHCHLGVGGVVARAGQRMWLPVGSTTVAGTPTYIDTVNVQAAGWMGGVFKRIAPMSPSTSAVHLRMNTRDSTPYPNAPNQMPPLATEAIDTAGVAAIDAWINTLP